MSPWTVSGRDVRVGAAAADATAASPWTRLPGRELLGDDTICSVCVDRYESVGQGRAALDAGGRDHSKQPIDYVPVLPCIYVAYAHQPSATVHE